MSFVDHKYVNAIQHRLRNFKQRSKDLFNFSCPLCGDSKKNKRKARGYIYQKKNDLHFKCFNCGEAMGMGNFLKRLDTVAYLEYCRERFPETFKRRTFSNQSSRKKGKVIFKHREDVHLPRLMDLEPSDRANLYAQSRCFTTEHLKVIHYAEDFRSWLLTHPGAEKYESMTSDSRIVFPYYDFEGKLFGAQGRVFYDTKKGYERYRTCRFRDDMPMVFGLDRWNMTKLTYIVEGPIDSLFLPNCLAASSSSLLTQVEQVLDRTQISTEMLVFVFDNEPRNPEVCRLQLNAINAGYKVVIWPDLIDEKDINDLVIGGMTPTQVLSLIEENSISGLQALVRFKRWCRCLT